MDRPADEGERLGRRGDAWLSTVPPLEWGFVRGTPIERDDHAGRR